MALIPLTHKTKILVTGGTGCIGFTLVPKLLRTGASVTVITRHPEGPKAAQLATEGARILPGDLSISNGLPAADKLGAMDIVLHLGADLHLTGPQVWNTNIEGTRRLLLLVDQIQAPYVIYASSIEAQGVTNSAVIPLPEEAPCRPLTDYGASKEQAECLVRTWGEQVGRQTVCFRIGNVYGPGSRALVFPWLRSLLAPSDWGRYYHRVAQRQFQPIYLEDLTATIIMGIKHRLEGTYNLMGTEVIRVGAAMKQLAELLMIPEAFTDLLTQDKGLLPSEGPQDPEVQYMLSGEETGGQRVYDTTKIQQAIGPIQRWPFCRGMAATVAWFQRAQVLHHLCAER